MKSIKRVFLTQDLIIELREDYIKPVTEEECLVKAESVLLTPLDILASKGRVESLGYGTLACGIVIEPQASFLNGRVYVSPRSPKMLPPVNQEGVGSSVFCFRRDCLQTPPSWVRYAELAYVYHVIQDTYYESAGRTLLVNTGGMQGILTTHLLRNTCYVYGVKSRKTSLNARAVSREALSRVSWDTVILSTINQGLAREVLREIMLENTHPRIIVNPFTAAVLELNVVQAVHGECKLVVPPETSCLERDVVSALESLVEKKSLIYRVRQDETPVRMYKEYVAIVF